MGRGDKVHIWELLGESHGNRKVVADQLQCANAHLNTRPVGPKWSLVHEQGDDHLLEQPRNCCGYSRGRPRDRGLYRTGTTTRDTRTLTVLSATSCEIVASSTYPVTELWQPKDAWAAIAAIRHSNANSSEPREYKSAELQSGTSPRFDGVTLLITPKATPSHGHHVKLLVM